MTRFLITVVAAFSLAPTHSPADCAVPESTAGQSMETTKDCANKSAGPLETMTIFGTAKDTRDVAGGASEISFADLQAFATTDVVRALRRVPGTSLQSEDGYGLRPNISIRGTPSERSSRITLLEDNILIAPAPYAAPSAYYFPTFGRIRSVEILKGPAGISQGPYTIGGAINLIATPIPDQTGGQLNLEGGSDQTWRTHAWYGSANARTSYLIETHLWKSDGFQHIDRSVNKTGLDKEDYTARLRFNSAPDARFEQSLNIKLQSSSEDSEQSYLGLSDTDFRLDPTRRYGLSALDQLRNTHDQVVLNWNLDINTDTRVYLSAYNNNTSRAWYKTEGIDFDGSATPEQFERTSWSSVVAAINNNMGIEGYTAGQLQGILSGNTTAQGSIQLRNNARDYFSRGFQGGGQYRFASHQAEHDLQFGFRLHKDEEDRLQRNDNYQQTGGVLVLDQRGLEGNAGNRIQSAKAWSLFVQDRIELGRWTLTPGLRYENIQQTRTDFGADPTELAGRETEDIKRIRSNREDFWIPGLGTLFRINDQWTAVAGVHKGFSAPGNRDGIKAETSINYEAGFRFRSGALDIEGMAFFQDYRNLQGICTASSGSNCEIGDAFNGNAVSVPGFEFMLTHDLAYGRKYSVPLQISYTWMDAEFDSAISDSEFFGDVQAGDPVPYIPDHQLFLSVGLEIGKWSAFMSSTYLDAVCTQASCGIYQQTDSSLTVDLGLHYHLTEDLEVYAAMENLTGALDIAGRQPYGARPGKDRSWLLGARWAF